MSIIKLLSAIESIQISCLKTPFFGGFMGLGGLGQNPADNKVTESTTNYGNQDAASNGDDLAFQNSIFENGVTQKQEQHDTKPLGFTHKVKEFVGEAKDSVSGFKDSALKSVATNAKGVGTAIKEHAMHAKEKASSLGNAILGKIRGENEDYVIDIKNEAKSGGAQKELTAEHRGIMNDFKTLITSKGSQRERADVQEGIKQLAALSEEVAEGKADISALKQKYSEVQTLFNTPAGSKSEATVRKAEANNPEEQAPLPPPPQRAPPSRPATPRSSAGSTEAKKLEEKGSAASTAEASKAEKKEESAYDKALPKFREVRNNALENLNGIRRYYQEQSAEGKKHDHEPFKAAIGVYKKNTEAMLVLEKKIAENPAASEKDKEAALQKLEGHAKNIENAFKPFEGLRPK